jgi:BirA family biotin operon repressor/biotin-[acetyl-CoA-carboxylase] ligase
MGFALSPRALAAGYRLASFECIGSTNAEAMVLARAGETGPMWVVAREQTEGRGRRGRDWKTARGNLAASLLVTVDVTPAKAATLGFVAGLALYEALGRCVPGLARGAAGQVPHALSRIALKWPNDVLVDGGKLAGILLESESVKGGLAVVIGMGVNVVSAPEDVPYPATSLASLGLPVQAEDLFTALSESWIAFMRLWDEGRGLAAIRSRWLMVAAGLGAPVSVRVGERTICGTFETLDDDGRLVLAAADDSRVTIAAGDVHFGDVATARAERM